MVLNNKCRWVVVHASQHMKVDVGHARLCKWATLSCTPVLLTHAAWSRSSTSCDCLYHYCSLPRTTTSWLLHTPLRLLRRSCTARCCRAGGHPNLLASRHLGFIWALPGSAHGSSNQPCPLGW